MNPEVWRRSRHERPTDNHRRQTAQDRSQNQNYYMQLDGNLTQGGFIELQVDGNINVTPNGLMGVYAQYSYEQLRGELTGTSRDGRNNGYFTTSYNFYTLKSIWTLGLSGSILF